MGNDTWARRIKMHRQAQGLTQREVARRAGVSTATLSRIEAGKRGISDTLKPRIARAVGATADVLFAFNEDAAA